MDRLLPSYEGRIDERTFNTDVTWHVTVPEENLDALVAALLELGRGEIRITTRESPAPAHRPISPP
jgi:hypothetical protein